MDNEDAKKKIGSKRKPHSYPTTNYKRRNAKTRSYNLESVQELYSETQPE